MIMDKGLQSLDGIIASIKAKSGKDAFASNRPKSRINYVICMLPRSGSSMFCSILEKTGLLGYPDEYLNPRGVIQMYAAKYSPSTFRDYFDVLRRERSTSNGVFGMKVIIDDLKPVIDSSMIKELMGPVQFIFLERQDLVLQAVSSVNAKQTGIWHRDASGAPYRSVATGDARFDEQAIIAEIDQLTQMRTNWERFFLIHSISPTRLVYEKLLENINEAVTQVAQAVGVTLTTPTDMSMSATSKLADHRSYEWAEAIRRKYRAKIE
jgi:LPS sulfotransferase NodH